MMAYILWTLHRQHKPDWVVFTQHQADAWLGMDEDHCYTEVPILERGKMKMDDTVICPDSSLDLSTISELIASSVAEKLLHSQKWQPIETAPKDGTGILGFLPKGRQFSHNYIATVTWCGAIEHWVTLPYTHEIEEVKWWMPLPEPSKKG